MPIEIERLNDINYKRSKAGSDMNRLADRVWMAHTINPGVAFARKGQSSIKDAMRGQVAREFRQRSDEKLRFLTLPGVSFQFEKRLLGLREIDDVARRRRKKEPQHTHLTCLEREEELFRAALRFLPGLHGGHNELRVLQSPGWATASVQTICLIGGFHRATFERMAYETTKQFDAAWLDFNGPLTERRAHAIQRFWRNSLGWRLVLTVLDARYDSFVRRHLEQHGSYEDWLPVFLGDAELLRSERYNDPLPMVQLTFGKGGPNG